MDGNCKTSENIRKERESRPVEIGFSILLTVRSKRLEEEQEKDKNLRTF